MLHATSMHGWPQSSRSLCTDARRSWCRSSSIFGDTTGTGSTVASPRFRCARATWFVYSQPLYIPRSLVPLSCSGLLERLYQMICGDRFNILDSTHCGTCLCGSFPDRPHYVRAGGHALTPEAALSCLLIPLLCAGQLDWKQRAGLELWYGTPPTNPLSDAMHAYETANDAPAPVTYASGALVALSSAK